MSYLPDLVHAAVSRAEGRQELPRFAGVAFASFTFSATQLAQGGHG
ncbi:conserved hypothetical protein [Ruegeria lacuscaerulensis ITI-1157]|nr:conserved hypothetical protein [Ruegeria lacuscaerulensis ITI-1157]